ncbi:MAG: 16S rRNA (cytosine(1402)-N(4))-methyltransferase RsmH [Burkholderiales bacterium]|nr:MAG: 16S rRNA (cytosine(1402)-N(4))-methyltransferase RsmH [Burkholderiales bacterium]
MERQEGAHRGHTTVLLGEAVDALAVRPEGTYVDGTFGRGGHARAILERLGPSGHLLAIDRDPEAVAFGAGWNDPRLEVVHGRFSELAQIAAAHGVHAADGVLLDLGVSSPQLDAPERGFSFRQDGPLDMRMDPGHGIPVREWLAQASEQDIAEVLKNYGEERHAVPIAKAIVARRRQAGAVALGSTGQLAALVAGVLRRRQGRPEVGKDPATRTFQALRIFVNQELEEVARVLGVALELLRIGGRLVVISFHSLEDRIVKQFMAREAGQAARSPRAPRGLPQPARAARLRLLGRRLPSAAECQANPRARSAVLRVAERTA